MVVGSDVISCVQQEKYLEDLQPERKMNENDDNILYNNVPTDFLKDYTPMEGNKKKRYIVQNRITKILETV